MSKIIQVLQTYENRVVMQVAGATITFGLFGEKVVDLVCVPPARECFIPQNLMWEAKKQAKSILLCKKERGTPNPVT